jgi:cysteine desulfurase
MDDPLPTRSLPVYLDCAATTPVEPAVLELVVHHLDVGYGNAGSRTHVFGSDAQHAVEHARRQVAAVVDADPDEVIFTSGATEANNLALLGLAHTGMAEGRRHILATEIEHKAVLEPLSVLAKDGFDVELVPPRPDGAVDAVDIVGRLRDDTLMVSVMQVNNETGIRQPIQSIAAGMADHVAFLHVDAAQGFGKDLESLRQHRIDLISVSGHKLYAPKGVGALIARRRNRSRVPLRPLMHGGGQERGLRPGTQPVALIAGLGLASALSLTEADRRQDRCKAIRDRLVRALSPLKPRYTGDPTLAVPHILNLSIPGLDTEAVILVLREFVAISNGSACTSARYEPSHVLRAMAVSDEQLHGAVRMSWSHLTPDPPYDEITAALRALN